MIEKIPVIIGAAQYRQSKHIQKPLDPLGLMEKASLGALSDAGGSSIKDLIDELYVINLFQWPYRDVPGMLAQRLSIDPPVKSYVAVGGNTPQMLVTRAARSLASGESRVVLMTGAESIYSIRRALTGGIALDWPASETPERVDGDNRSGLSELEARYDLFLPSYMYPLFETALRAFLGHSPDDHQLRMGALFSRFSAVAASNPYAWSRDAFTAGDIAKPDADNRYIGYPYTKRMNANINVDQSAALLMTTVKTAQELGIDPARWVYPLAGSDLNDIWHVSRRPRLYRSPAIRTCARLCLEEAGLALADIGVFDLYSCFPAVVQIAMMEIGIPLGDRRDLSVTGGLPYFGGPGNNYSMHAIAAVVERIRADRSLKAMVTANGWYMTKHAAGIYGGAPPLHPWHERQERNLQEEIDAGALRDPVERASGSLTVEAYVIRHARTGRPGTGTVIGRLKDGCRALAHIEAGTEDLEKWERVELVGKTGTVRFDADSGCNVLTII